MVAPDDLSHLSVIAAHERALVFMYRMPRIWEDYLHYLIHLKSYSLARKTFNRALCALPVTQHFRLWQPYLTALKEENLHESVISAYRRYLKVNPAAVEDFIDYLMEIDQLNAAAKEITNCLSNPKWVPLKAASRHTFWMQLCTMIAENPQKIQQSTLQAEALCRQGLREYSEEVGVLWTSLADHYIRAGCFDRARDIFEEAMAAVVTARDFAVVFEGATSLEEQLIAAAMEREAVEAEEDTLTLDMNLMRLELLMDRRPFLLSSVLLRQNPQSVLEWLQRCRLFMEKGDLSNVAACFEDAVRTIDVRKAVGKVSTLWVGYLTYLMEQESPNAAEIIQLCERAILLPLDNLDELTSLWTLYIEYLILSEGPAVGLARLQVVMKGDNRALQEHRQEHHHSAASTALTAAQCARLQRSSRLWSLYADLVEEVEGCLAAKAVYERMLELKVATAQQVLNAAKMLEENKYWEEAFHIFERGVCIFAFPVATELWLTYLGKFMQRYRGRKVERTRDLFEQVLAQVPRSDAKYFYMLYGSFEESYGLASNVRQVYGRAVLAVDDVDAWEMTLLLLSKTAAFEGVPFCREIFEGALNRVPANNLPDASMHFAEMERKLGEVDRARIIYLHGAQYADPEVRNDFWEQWHNFEVMHGNPETYKEMLRVKRSVQVKFTPVWGNVTEGGDSSMAQLDAAAAGKGKDSVASASASVAFLTTEGRAELKAMEAEQDNEEEIDLDAMDEGGDEDQQADGESKGESTGEKGSGIQEIQVPSAVFGSLASQHYMKKTRNG